MVLCGAMNQAFGCGARRERQSPTQVEQKQVWVRHAQLADRGALMHDLAIRRMLIEELGR